MFEIVNKLRKITNKNKTEETARATILDVNNFQVVESYKQLRINIMFAMSAKNAKVVEVSSSFPGEGKSITSANIAIAMAQIGVKVLLLDCDLRKSVQHRIFKVENKIGLSSVLGKMETFEKAVNKNIIENLDLITAGPVPPNPSELIASQNMEEFVKKIEDLYDYIIIDTPPINVVSDALELSKYTGGLVLVTRQGVTTYEDVRHAINSAKILNINIFGIVVNGIIEDKFNSYGRYGKYGKYSKYGKYGKYKKYGYEYAVKDK